MTSVRITPYLAIDPTELRFTFTASGGPGGQNVNKVATKAVLHFDVGGSPSLTDEQRARIRQSLAGRISRNGVLRIVCSSHRTQEANRRGAIETFSRLAAAALRPRKTRKKTRPSRAAVQRRLSEKAIRSRRKQERRGGDERD